MALAADDGQDWLLPVIQMVAFTLNGLFCAIYYELGWRH